MDKNDILTNEKTWDAIAESFNVTRRKPWPQVIDFIKEISDSKFVADIGCGNGRHLIPCAKLCNNVVGIDISKKLLNIVKNKCKDKGLNNVDVIHANMTSIPLKNCSLEAILCVASLHNIKGRENRISSLKEINRILIDGGKALISVWSRWQDKYRYHFLKKFINSKEEFGDINIYWRQHNLNIPRYYHLYSKREFINDIKKTNLEVESIKCVKLHSKISTDNYFAIVQKG